MTPRDPQQLAEAVVKKMYDADLFSQWLGLEVLELRPGYCRLAGSIRPEMCNGFGICHGGITFSIADSALAFACNTNGRVTVAANLSIQYLAPVRVGDRLEAAAQLRAAGGRLYSVDVEVTNQEQQLVALFRATAYRTSEEHFSDA